MYERTVDASLALAGATVTLESLGSGAATVGTATRPALEARVDGSVGMVDMGDFTVSHPFPQVVGEAYHEYNNKPGYQGRFNMGRVRGPSVNPPGIDGAGFVAASTMIDPSSDKLVVRAGGAGLMGVMYQATPAEGSLGRELVKPSLVVTTPRNGLAPTMDQLLDGPVKLAVVGPTGTGTVNTTDAFGTLTRSPLKDIRIVTFTGTRATGAAPYENWSEIIPFTLPRNNVAVYHETEFRGTISGYVLHNVDDDARVDADEAVEGVLVLARAGRRPDGAVVDSARTDRTGKFSLWLWEGTYVIDPVGETFPAYRTHYEVGFRRSGGIEVYHYAGGGKILITPEFASPNTPGATDPSRHETDFFVLYNKGIIELDVSAANGRNPLRRGRRARCPGDAGDLRSAEQRPRRSQHRLRHGGARHAGRRDHRLPERRGPPTRRPRIPPARRSGRI